MAIAELQSWLSSRVKNYDTGLKLFEKYGDDEFTLDMLRLGNNDYNRQELYRLLLEASRQESPAVQSARKVIATDQEYVRLIPKAQQLVDQAKDLMKLNGNRVGELDGIIDRALKITDPIDQEKFLKENETGDKANMILDTDDVIAELFEKIDYCKKHGKLPDSPAESQLPEHLSYAELKSMQANLRSQRSKAKGDPEKLKILTDQLVDIDRRLRDFV